MSKNLIIFSLFYDEIYLIVLPSDLLFLSIKIENLLQVHYNTTQWFVATYHLHMRFLAMQCICDL